MNLTNINPNEVNQFYSLLPYVNRSLEEDHSTLHLQTKCISYTFPFAAKKIKIQIIRQYLQT